MQYYLAIDIGASSGRHILGWMEEGSLHTKEIYRFSNGVRKENGHLVWDTEHLVASVKAGVEKAAAEYTLKSLAIDTWGVDYVLLKEGKELLPVYSYRDSRTLSAVDTVHALVPFQELYARTGCQFQSFNTVYQLYADKMTGRLDGAEDLLMIPEYLSWKLCGEKIREYTNATTTGLVCAKNGQYDMELIRKLGYPERLFPELTGPGKVIGNYRGIDVVLAATHDTASAVEGIPMGGDEKIYISSGTWSLMGVKIPEALTGEESRNANFTNEGGVGYIRYLKNIMGMWVINGLKQELCPELGFDAVVSLAEQSSFEDTADVNETEFFAPESMKAVFDKKLCQKPSCIGDYFRAAYRSLALSYANTARELEVNTGRNYNEIIIVGGGAKNSFLNRLTEEMSGKKVTALPIEATALGNLKIQMKAEEQAEK